MRLQLRLLYCFCASQACSTLAKPFSRLVTLAVRDTFSTPKEAFSDYKAEISELSDSTSDFLCYLCF